MSIYVNFEIPESPKEFLIAFYSVLWRDRAYCKETYFDKECTRLQCSAQRLRSFEDLFELLTTYYTDLTKKDVIEILSSTVLKSNVNVPLYLHISNCSTISRIRVFYYEDINSCALDFNCSKYNSEFSWADLFKLINVNSREEYREYLKNLEK